MVTVSTAVLHCQCKIINDGKLKSVSGECYSHAKQATDGKHVKNCVCSCVPPSHYQLIK